MIGKHTKGKTPYGALSYVLGKEGAEVITTNMGSSINPADLAHEMEYTWAGASRLNLPVYHASLTIPKTEALDNSEWGDVARTYLKEMGFGTVPYIVVKHSDTDHDHIHIVAGRLNLETNRCVDDGWDHLRSRDIIQQLERQYNLTPTAKAWESQTTFPTLGMIREEERTDKPAIKAQLQDLINETCKTSSTFEDLATALKAEGVELDLALTRTNNVGIAYHYKDLHFSGSQLGKGHTLNGLQQHHDVSLPGNLEDPDKLLQMWNEYRASKQETIEAVEEVVGQEIQEQATLPRSRPYYRIPTRDQEQQELSPA